MQADRRTIDLYLRIALELPLKKLLVVVKRWAAHTATKRDDGVAEALSIGLDASAAGLEWAKHWLELAALNKGWNEQVVEVKPVSK